MASRKSGRTLRYLTSNIFQRQLNYRSAILHFQNDLYMVPARHQSNSEIVGKIAAKEPFEVHLVDGKRYSWCRCGFSKKQPFCDGQHRRNAPGISPLRFHAENTGTVFLCGCKQTGNPPFCDGTHMSDKVQNAFID